jgi:hypothetical protein
MCSIASTSRRSVATGVCRASSSWIPLLDLEVAAIDRVVERDHLVGELGVRAPQRVQRAAQRAQHEAPFLQQARLQGVEVLLEADATHQPNRPVT